MFPFDEKERVGTCVIDTLAGNTVILTMPTYDNSFCFLWTQKQDFGSQIHCADNQLLRSVI